MSSSKLVAKQRIKDQIRKDVLYQVNRNDKMIEDKKKSVKVKQLQKILETDESDIDRLKKLQKYAIRLLFIV